MNLDGECARCGREFSDDEWRGVHVDDGRACWACLTLEEQRRAQFQCERCGAQYHDDGDDPDVGWIIEFGATPRFLCPDCITYEEDLADTQRFLAGVEAGMAFESAQGREYPADLARLAELEAARIERRRRQRDDFDRRLGGKEQR